MKYFIILILFYLKINTFCFSQDVRYFEFLTTCGHGNWQDSTFIAATSDQSVIDTIFTNLALPLEQRKFISGRIDYGNGGHNHNADHWFLWHFVPNQWNLTEVAMEVCDGCPYTDVDMDTAYWVGNIGIFCPWTGQPVREVPAPVGAYETALRNLVNFYPNPAKDYLYFDWISSNDVSVSIFNVVGQKLATCFLTKQNSILNLSGLDKGTYFFKITDGNKFAIKKVIIEKG